LVECAALLDSVRRGELDRLSVPQQPLDVLAQQIAAEVCSKTWDEDDLYQLIRRAWPYRALGRDDFQAIVGMLTEGPAAAPRAARRSSIHHDAVNQRAARAAGARLTTLTSGGTIPDNADYQVLLEPENTSSAR
jgi:ATP-dependent Lhr-like helicase